MHVTLIPNVANFPSESMRRYATELSAALLRIAPPAASFETLVCDPANTPAHRFGESWSSRYARFLDYPTRIKNQAARHRAPDDLFHVLDHSHANLVLSLPAARAVLTCHDVIPLLAALGEIDMPTGRFTRHTFPGRLACARRCAHIVTISEISKRDLVRLGRISEEKITVAPLGVQPDFSPRPQGGLSRQGERAATLSRIGVPPDARVVLHVGTANRYKNTPALFHALASLRTRGELSDRVWLVRAGAAFFDDEARMVDDLGLANRVVHVGRVADNAGLAALYRAADVFAFPSLYEGFGWPPLEAMACETAVVSSNAASLPEVVGESGLLVDPKDNKALADALFSVLVSEPLRLELARKAHARASLFTWDRCAKTTLSVYERVAAGQVATR